MMETLREVDCSIRVIHSSVLGPKIEVRTNRLRMFVPASECISEV